MHIVLISIAVIFNSLVRLHIGSYWGYCIAWYYNIWHCIILHYGLLCIDKYI